MAQNGERNGGGAIARSIFWLVCFVALVLQPMTHESERRRWLTYAGMGGALGLAILTKGTAYVYAAPFVLWAAVSIVRAERGRAWGPALCIASIVLVMKRSAFNDLVHHEPHLGMVVMRNIAIELSNRLRKANAALMGKK